MRYDVIVVGAGPAGSTTAREAALRGLRVLLLDKAAFPRNKPCGGGVNIRAANLLPFDLAPVVEQVIYGVQFSFRYGNRFSRSSQLPLTYLTQRCRLDTFLAEQAVKVGVTFFDHTPVTRVERNQSQVTVYSGAEKFTARTLVAADGANGPVARLAGLERRISRGIALEGNITPAGGLPPEWQGVLGMELGSIAGGYGWLFPKGDHVNIGVGGHLTIGPQIRQHLRQMTRFYGFNPDALWGVQGHPLPMRLPDTPLVDHNLLLVGDAAGLLDPLLGEGIYAAIMSGNVAAQNLARYLNGDAPHLWGYQEELERTLIPELNMGHHFHRIIQQAPRLYVSLARRMPRAWGGACKVVRGDYTYLDLSRHPLVRLSLGVESVMRRLRGTYQNPASYPG